MVGCLLLFFSTSIQLTALFFRYNFIAHNENVFFSLFVSAAVLFLLFSYIFIRWWRRRRTEKNWIVLLLQMDFNACVFPTFFIFFFSSFFFVILHSIHLVVLNHLKCTEHISMWKNGVNFWNGTTMTSPFRQDEDIYCVRLLYARAFFSFITFFHAVEHFFYFWFIQLKEDWTWFSFIFRSFHELLCFHLLALANTHKKQSNFFCRTLW